MPFFNANYQWRAALARFQIIIWSRDILKFQPKCKVSKTTSILLPVSRRYVLQSVHANIKTSRAERREAYYRISRDDRACERISCELGCCNLSRRFKEGA